MRVLLREVQRHLRTRARARGLAEVRGGAVAILQRFGGALNLNVHIHALAETSPVLAGLAAAVPGMVALGGTPGARPRRVGQTSVDPGVSAPDTCHARWEGFDLHAALRVPAGQRSATGLERVFRYALRPPAAGGQVMLHLRRPVARLIPTHLALPADVPRPAPARGRAGGVPRRRGRGPGAVASTHGAASGGAMPAKAAIRPGLGARV